MEKQKTYGFLNNFIYALNIERKSNLRLLAITLIKPIGDIVGTLLNSYAPKYVLSFIDNHSMTTGAHHLSQDVRR